MNNLSLISPLTKEITGYESPEIPLIHKLVVVRHSERIDERPDLAQSWEMMKLQHRRKFNQVRKSNTGEYVQPENCFSHDCPITAEGQQIAVDVANVLASQFPRERLRKIYSSKCLRSVQTAYEIAKHYGVPIYLSRGFSLTANHVARLDDRLPNGFEFKSIENLRHFCPDVELIDCDIDPASSNYIPSRNWYEPLAAVISKDPLAIVIAHRETIKALRDDRSKIPYCGYGVFESEVISAASTKDKSVDPGELFQRIVTERSIGGYSANAFNASGASL